MLKIIIYSISLLFLFTSISFPLPIDEHDNYFDLFDEPEATVITIHDPLIAYNKAMIAFNNTAYDWVFRPALKGYQATFPAPIRLGVYHAFQNILFPIRVINNALQLNMPGVATETSRFMINSTIGLGGVMDPAAAHFGLYPKPEDFGQTLGVWGIGTGPYFVWPIFGPSTARDSIGLIVDYFTNPLYFIEPAIPRYTLKVVQIGSQTEQSLDTIDNLRKNALDFYHFSRDIYYQNRAKNVKN
jgi:phospholipid-binding lipoprotein MlaA